MVLVLCVYRKHFRQDQSSPSVDDEQDNPPSVVELSVSESQPIDRYGTLVTQYFSSDVCVCLVLGVRMVMG